ncbi:MAG: L28 family ribosomal protein, partial [Candidatus Portnoybacteria bacterium]|nr:L28 family ribosomal protein [Candidatus Portnoybacteria bacterium]
SQNFQRKAVFWLLFCCQKSSIKKFMAQSCAVCGKQSQMSTVRVKLRGKFNPTSKTRRYPNLQWARLANGKRVKVCTRCMKKKLAEKKA